MANARTKSTKVESLEELQTKRNNAYFMLGDKAYHVIALATDIWSIVNNISVFNKTISDRLKSEEKKEDVTNFKTGQTFVGTSEGLVETTQNA